MSQSPSAFLTEEHYQNLKNSLDTAKQIQREIDLAKMAGIDVTKPQALLDEYLSNTAKIKQVYFPGR